MAYYILTDPIRRDEVILVDGRKHFRFVFGPFQWERTTLFQPYLTAGTPYFEKYREGSPQEANELLKQKAARILKMMGDAKTIAEKVYAGSMDCSGEPFLKHIQEEVDALPDMEEKIAALLQDTCSRPEWNERSLMQAGFSPAISRAAVLLAGTAGESYADYLQKLRFSRIARNVKLMDLSWLQQVCQQVQCTETIKKARQYLYGDIPEFSDELDEAVLKYDRLRLVPSMQAYSQIRSQAFFGRKVPHGTSNPVLRLQDGNLFLAYFVYTFTRAELQAGVLSRPVTWILAKPDTGELVQELVCREKDFSTAQSDCRCSTENPNGIPGRAFFEECYRMLDDVRGQWLRTGVFPWESYEAYLSRMLTAVPESYHRFYRELSITPEQAKTISEKAGV